MFKLPQAPKPVTHQRAANALRALAMDAVEAAKSGHPGMPMGMADIAEVLWNHFLVHDPADPRWPNRDRFVVSNGHGSMLLYALLHLSGYELPMEELRRFRQLHSLTPGHPEYAVTPGVETSTGPLGQGLANAVGMALAERLLAAEFNRPGFEVVNHRTWVFVGDGCLMEGISHEAASLAGTLGLDRLIVVYDDNRISIDGDTDGWFRDDTAGRFEACGWRVLRQVDGHDPESLFRAFLAAKGGDGRPTLICCKTVIGKGAPTRQGSAKVHGAPLGAEEIVRARAALDWPHPPFHVPEDVAAHWNARLRGREAHHEWDQVMYAYAKAHPELAIEFERRMRGGLPAHWPNAAAQAVATQLQGQKPVATRKASEQVLDVLGPQLPELFGGSADLTESNLTRWKDAPVCGPGVLRGRYLSWGVREFGMAAALNGMALHGGWIPFGGTFAVFSDYARNAIRMAALMRLRVVHVLTHDSIGLGEDGPTHQPVEHAASLRLIPHLDVWRPADGVETAVAWQLALERTDGPSALLLSRQAVPLLKHGADAVEHIGHGGYVLAEAGGAPQVVLIATGSEVGVALQAQALLAEQGFAARVVSMPCTARFDRQPGIWRHAVLPPGVPRVAVEAGHPDGWRKYVGLEGAVIGLAEFGESAPAPQLFEHFGINAAAVAEAARVRIVNTDPRTQEPSRALPVH